MSSPFQKSFSAKSPITTSPLKAGGYASGVDGMRYVSPKQPESNTLPVSRPKKDKTPEREEIKPSEVSVLETTPIKPITIDGIESARKNINETQFREIAAIIPGQKVEKIEKNQQKYLNSFKSGFAKNPEGTTNITDYRLKKERKYKPTTTNKNQKRSRTGTEDLDTGVKTYNPFTDWSDIVEQ